MMQPSLMQKPWLVLMLQDGTRHAWKRLHHFWRRGLGRESAYLLGARPSVADGISSSSARVMALLIAIRLAWLQRASHSVQDSILARPMHLQSSGQL